MYLYFSFVRDKEFHLKSFPVKQGSVCFLHMMTSPVNSPHKSQWRGALMFSLFCAWTNGWANNRHASDLRRHRAHYDVIVMIAGLLITGPWKRPWHLQPNLYGFSIIPPRIIHTNPVKCVMKLLIQQGFLHDDVIKWKHFPRYWPFVRGIHRSPVNSPQKGQWHRALIFSLMRVWINGCVNNREAGDLRRYRAHYDVSVMVSLVFSVCPCKYIYIKLATSLMTHHWSSYIITFLWNTNALVLATLCHQMETLSALLALCEGNPPVISQRPVTRSFVVFFDLRLNKRLSKQSRRQWFGTPSRSLWRPCNEHWYPLAFYEATIRAI